MLLVAFFLLPFAPNTTVEAELPPPVTHQSVQELVTYFSKQYKVSPVVMTRVMKCENPEGNPKLQSRIINKKGVREKSYGLVQIHLPSHPEVSYAQATNAEFSVEFLAKGLKNNPRQWSCYRKLYA